MSERGKYKVKKHYLEKMIRYHKEILEKEKNKKNEHKD
jgi:hypothetical protein